MNNILEYLDELFPNPKSELIYTKDYEFLISVMLSAQTTDKLVNKVTGILFNKYPSLEALKKADIEDIKEILKPIGLHEKKAKNVIEIASKLNDGVPNDYEFVISLPGVGRKTANVVLGTLYNEPYFGVDTHVERIAKRLNLVDKTDSTLVIEKKFCTLIDKSKINRVHHQLVLFGRYYCKAQNPLCNKCKLKDICKNISL